MTRPFGKHHWTRSGDRIINKTVFEVDTHSYRTIINKFYFLSRGFLKESGRGIGGLRKAPLNLIIKIKPPKKATCGVPAGRS